MDNSEKLKALDAAISKIEKDFGKGAIMKLGDKSKNMDVETVPTGSLSLDLALGLGGLPKGRVVEIYGPESSGKTTVTLHMVAEVQKRGGIAGFIDAEHALDPSYARRIGVDIDNLYISQPDNGEQALEITEMMVRSGAVDIIVVDSVAALVPKAEIDGDMGDSHVGLQARLMSQALRKLTAIISKSNCIVIFINQLREKVGVMFGSPETTTGGRALKFYSSIRMDIRRIEAIKQGGEIVGNRTRVKVVKNKVAPPKLNLILCLVRVYQEKGIFLIWQPIRGLSTRAARGILIMMPRLVRGVRIRRTIFGKIRRLWKKLNIRFARTLVWRQKEMMRIQAVRDQTV